MVDIAELGLEIDSKQATAAARELDKLTASGKRTEDALKGIERAAGMADQKSKEYTQSIARAYGINDQLTKSQVSTIRSYETQIGQQTLLNEGRKREAAQFVALRQAQTTADSAYGRVVADLAAKHYDLQQAQDKTDQSGSNLANTLTRRLLLGVLIMQVREAAQAVLNLNSELAKIGDTASRIGSSTAGLQGLQFGFATKGGNPAEFLDSMLKFNQQVTQAQIGLGSLGALLRANGVAAHDTEDAFFKVADLVKNASNEADKFSIAQQAGLPASREMVKFLEQGADAIRRAAREAPIINDEAIKRAKEIEEQFNKLWASFVLKGKQAVVEVFDMQGWEQAGRDAAGYFWRAWKAVNNATGGNIVDQRTQITAPDLDLTGGDGSATRFNPNPTVNVELELKKNAALQARLGLLGNLKTAEEARLQVENQIYSAHLQQIQIDETRAKILAQQAYEQALGITNIKAQSDALAVEAQTVGMTTAAATEYQAVQALILENRRKGIDLQSVENAGKLAEIEAAAAALGNRKAELDAAKTLQEIQTSDPLGQLEQKLRSLDEQLMRGKLNWDVYGEAARRAQLNTAAQAFGLAASLATSLGTIFKRQKEGAIAAAVLNTAESITKTMAQYGATPWGLAAAAVAAAAGAAQIATIKSTMPGSSGSVSAPNSGGAPVDVVAAPTAAPSAPDRSVHVTISGRRGASEEEVFELIDAINETFSDGGPTISVRRSN